MGVGCRKSLGAGRVEVGHRSRSALSALATVLVAGLGLGLASGASAQTFHGRLTSSLYAWQRAPDDSTDFDHVRFYQLGIFHLEQVADRRLSLHTYMRVHGDLSDDLNELSNWRLLNLYAQWKDDPRHYELRGGRMRIYAGVGNVTVDGGYGRYQYPRWGALEAYVGVQPPLAGNFEVSDWENRAYGGRLTLDRWQQVKVALSFARRQRATLAYEEVGQYTGRALELPAEQEEVYGADASWLMRPGTRLYGRMEVDASQRQLKWGNTVFSWGPPETPWSADLEYMHRAPSIYANSLLSVFDHSDYDEVSVRGGYQAAPQTRVHADFASTFFDDDQSFRYALGVEHGPVFFNGSLRSGYGGELASLTAGYSRPLREWVDVRAQAGVSSYQIVGEVQNESNSSFVVLLGGEFKPRRDLAIDLEVQNLTQDIHSQPAFAGYDYDLRGHLRVTYWFFTGRGRPAAAAALPATEPGAPAGS